MGDIKMTIEEIFPDKVLARLIAKKLQRLENEVIYEYVLLETQSLNYDGENKDKIKSIEGIHRLKNLTQLSLINNNIVDISPLTKLKKINHLDLTSNKIENLKPLKDLQSLRLLVLQDNKIKDISSLGNLNKLRLLNLSKNRIENISVLENCEDLEVLRLHETLIDNVSSLVNLKKLDTLDFRNTNVLEIPNFYKSYMSFLLLPKIENLNNLIHFKYLSCLTLHSESNFATLPLLENLSDLAVYNTQKSLLLQSYIGSLSNLQKLNGFLDCVHTLDDYSFINNLPDIGAINFMTKI